MNETVTYRVAGMTCGHCVAAITSEISALDGVTDVTVDLEAGTVDVTGVGGVPGDSVQAAVDEAGFEVIS